MKQSSIRLRLLLMIAIPLSIGLIAISSTSYLSAKHEAEEIYDAQLAHFARIVGLLTQHEIDEGDISEKLIFLHTEKFNTPYEKDFAYRVWRDADIILQSDNAKTFGSLTQSTGFTDRVINKNRWRFFVLKEANITVEIAEDYHARYDLIQHVAFSILLPVIFIIPLAFLAIWCGVQMGMAPLDALSALIMKQKPEALTPLEMKTTPLEVLPLVSAINRLMKQIEQVIEKEKQFTSYAAHELRTPLAALKTQVQVALRTKDAVLQQQMFFEVTSGIDRMSHLVSQLLTLMRVQNFEHIRQQLNLSALVQQSIKAFALPAQHKHQTLKLAIFPDLYIEGNNDLISILLRNLLENAICYTPVHGEIDLTLTKVNHHIELTVANSGATLSAKQHEKIFEPFYRGDENETSGAGLGLAIVKWITNQHSATIFCTNTDKEKTEFRIEFPTNSL